MPQKRMFSMAIIDSDAFIDMPATTRLLYFDLNMRADDDGFVNSPKKIMKMTGASTDDMNILIARKFVLDMGDGVIVIKHWRIHNYIANDRYKETTYQDKMRMLEIDDNKAYRRIDNNACIQIVDNLDTQISIDKNSVDKNRIEKSRSFIKPSVQEVRDYVKENKYNVDPEAFVDFYESKNWYVGKNKMCDWKASVRTWNKKSNKRIFTADEMETTEQDIDELKKRLFEG